MAAQSKGVREIKTHSSILGSGVHSNERHVHQFQLASLELERTRRGREKKAALQRIANIDARLAEIDELVRKHQEALGLTGAGGPGQEATTTRSKAEAVPDKRRVLRY
jgi:hypothetical protein